MDPKATLAELGKWAAKQIDLADHGGFCPDCVDEATRAAELVQALEHAVRMGMVTL